MKKSEMQKLHVYETLLTLRPVAMHPPQYEAWLKTREIADACNQSIYTARLYLLALEQEGKVFCSHRNINNSLHWYPRWPSNVEIEGRMSSLSRDGSPMDKRQVSV